MIAKRRQFSESQLSCEAMSETNKYSFETLLQHISLLAMNHSLLLRAPVLGAPVLVSSSTGASGTSASSTGASSTGASSTSASSTGAHWSF